jgi:AcrR family transcriptional regulator
MKSDVRHAAPEVGGIRAKALSAAARILAVRGVEDLNLRAIADAAGIGLASIYYYFKNKEELLLNLAVMGFGDLRDEIVRYQKSGEHGSAMQASAQAFFAFARARPALFSLMFDTGMLARHEELRDAERKTLLIYQAAVEADPRIPKQHSANAAFALWALGRGMAAIFSSYPAGEVPAEITERLFSGASYLINHPS